MNDIIQLQDQPDQLQLMRARRQTYYRAMRWMLLQFILTVAMPIAGEVTGLIAPPVRPYVAILALALGALDVVILDRAQTRLLKVAAKLQEQFDCIVLHLPWNGFAVGPKLDAEDVHEAARAYARRGGTDDALKGWYPAVVAQAPLHLARLICQRTNLWYDGKLRRRYGGIVLTAGWILFGALFVAGLALKLSLTDFVVTILVPAAPFLTWVTRERHRQSDTADQLDAIRQAETALWTEACAGQCAPEHCLARSREFQDAIYARRAGSPLIFPFIYWIMRSDLEDQMNAGAEQRMRELGLTLKPTPGPP